MVCELSAGFNWQRDLWFDLLTCVYAVIKVKWDLLTRELGRIKSMKYFQFREVTLFFPTLFLLQNRFNVPTAGVSGIALWISVTLSWLTPAEDQAHYFISVCVWIKVCLFWYRLRVYTGRVHSELWTPEQTCRLTESSYKYLPALTFFSLFIRAIMETFPYFPNILKH